MITDDDEDMEKLVRSLEPLRRARLAQALLKSLNAPDDPDVAEWAMAAIEAEREARHTSLVVFHGPTVARACDIIAGHIASDSGLLARLRPYVGVDPAQLDELLGAMKTLYAEARSLRTIPFDAIENAVQLLQLVQRWALDEDGMLRRNRLIGTAEWEMLRDWSDEFSSALGDTLHQLAENETWRGLTRR